MASIAYRVARFSAKLQRQILLPSINQKRNAYIGQPIFDPEVVPRKYEVSKDPEEWKYVTRLLPQKTVPPFSLKSDYPSGWVPPNESGKNHPYFVERSKNHMLPLYLEHAVRGQLKITTIRKIHGDIWLLHDELKAHIEKMGEKRIASQVLESNSIIKFKGDKYHWAEQFLLSKGF